MKTIIKQFALIAALICSINLVATAQVTPSTAGVKLFCSGSNIDLGAAPAGTTWEVAYSATSTTSPGIGATLSGNEIISPQTGYYYIMTKGTEPGACISEWQEIPVYILTPIAVDFSGFEICIENATSSTLTGTATSTSTDTNTPDFAYQWYTVAANGDETAITGATNPTYTPTLAAANTTYRLKAGYLIGGNKYCSTTKDHTISVTAAPAKPTININTPGDSW